eukprot:6460608-Amphidinium_carterae.1
MCTLPGLNDPDRPVANSARLDEAARIHREVHVRIPIRVVEGWSYIVLAVMPNSGVRASKMCTKVIWRAGDKLCKTTSKRDLQLRLIHCGKGNHKIIGLRTHFQVGIWDWYAQKFQGSSSI